MTAASKKVFTGKAVAIKKVGKKPELDSPVYFKEDVPKKKDAPRKKDVPKPDEVLAKRMLEVLEAQRLFGGDRYPPTLQHLGELCDGTPSPALIVAAASKKVFTDEAVAIKKEGKKPTLDSPVYFKEDVPKPEEVLAKRMLAVLESQQRLVLRPTRRRCGAWPSSAKSRPPIPTFPRPPATRSWPIGLLSSQRAERIRVLMHRSSGKRILNEASRPSSRHSCDSR